MKDLLRLAERYATEKHMGQVDRAGVPYVEHPRTVAGMLDGETERIVAWLHDTVEDTDATIDEIRRLFGDEVAVAVDHLTRRKGEPYMNYIRRVKENELARKVKLADLEHNMDLSRLPVVTEDDALRRMKYCQAKQLLM